MISFKRKVTLTPDVKYPKTYKDFPLLIKDKKVKNDGSLVLCDKHDKFIGYVDKNGFVKIPKLSTWRKTEFILHYHGED